MKPDSGLYKKTLNESGFVIIKDVFNDSEIERINECIDSNKENHFTTNHSKDLFALRKIFSALPGIKNYILNDNIKYIIQQLFGLDYFIVKGLYFDKPALSNWFVAYHQDLSICVSNKTDSSAYKGWTIKKNQFGVQPPLAILENIYTIRIHLDDCTAQNGALHVVPGSHKKGIYKSVNSDPLKEEEVVCEVTKGSVMLMRPLLLHASHKSTAAVNRRVLHIEFCNTELPDSVQWAEKELVN